MQTFLPLQSFAASLRALDDKRLGKQRLETHQLLNGHRRHHPAAKMWQGYREALILYYNMSLAEWDARGFVNDKLQLMEHPQHVTFPPWLGDPRFHLSHRLMLCMKDPLHYGRLWPEECEQIRISPLSAYYVWPRLDRFAVKGYRLVCA